MALNLCFYFILLLLNFANAVLYSTVNDRPTRKSNTNYNVVELLPDQIYAENGKKFTVFCHEGEPKSVLHTFRSASLVLEHAPSNYKLYGGANETEAYEKYTSESIWHPKKWFPWKDKTIEFPVFDPYCIGIKADEQYGLRFSVRTINFWKLVQMVTGMLLFFTSSTLCRNTIFLYGLAVSIGVSSFLLLFLYLVFRNVMPSNNTKLMMVFGTFPMIYGLQWVFYNLEYLLYQHMQVVLAYIAITAIISACVFYRYGSTLDSRTHDILQGFIKLCGGAFMFFSSEYHEVTTAVVIVFIFAYAFGFYLKNFTRHVWFRYFPPKVKFLSETEYIEQGHIETTKALSDLRSFCISPDCNSWKVMEKLKCRDRFLSFMNNGNHLTDDELLAHNGSLVEDNLNLTDDDSF